MGDSTTLTVRMSTDLKTRLEALAKATRRSKSFLAAEAIAAFVELNAWQVDAIRQGLKAADRGELIAQQEIETWVGSWGGDDEVPPPEVA